MIADWRGVWSSSASITGVFPVRGEIGVTHRLRCELLGTTSTMGEGGGGAVAGSAAAGEAMRASLAGNKRYAAIPAPLFGVRQSELSRAGERARGELCVGRRVKEKGEMRSKSRKMQIQPNSFCIGSFVLTMPKKRTKKSREQRRLTHTLQSTSALCLSSAGC